MHGAAARDHKTIADSIFHQKIRHVIRQSLPHISLPSACQAGTFLRYICAVLRIAGACSAALCRSAVLYASTASRIVFAI